MIKYQKISGISISGQTSLPSIQKSPEGEAMGSVPGWSSLLDPSYASAADLTARNRARASTVFEIGTFGTEDPNPIREFSGGEPAFVSEGERRISIRSSVEVSPERWSVFGVIQPAPRESGTGAGYLTSLIGASEISLSAGWSRVSLDSFSVYERSSISPRITADVNFFERSSPSLIMATFSVERGLEIYDGGVLVASEPDDKRPLELSGKVGQAWLNNGSVTAGMCGLLNIDLGAPENTGHRRAIEKFLMDKYDIPEGPQ